MVSKTNRTFIAVTLALCIFAGGLFVQALLTGKSSVTITPSNIVIFDPSGNVQFYQGQAQNMTVWSGSSFPASAVVGQLFYRTDLYALYYYNGTWQSIQRGAQGATGPAGPNEILSARFSVYLNYTDSLYYGQRYDGAITTNTNSTRLINNCIGNLTANRITPETIQLMGNVTCNGTILMNSYTRIIGPAVLLAAPNTGQGDFIENSDIANCVEVYLDGFDILGTNQHSGSGIDIYVSQQDLSDTQWQSQRHVVINNMKIRNIVSTGISIQNNDASKNAGPVYITNTWTHYCGGYGGLYLANCTDAEISNVHTAGVTFYHITSGLVSGLYAGNFGGADSVNIDNCQRTRFSDIKVDSFSHNGMVVSGGCRSLEFCNVEIKIGTQLSSDNTYDAIDLTNADYCTFNGITVHQTSGTNQVKYCVEESSSSTNNVYGTMILEDYKLYGFRVLSSTKYSSTLIIGTITTS